MTTPHCLTSERSLLGCIVTSAGRSLDELAITPEHFFDESFRDLFIACQSLHSRGVGIDQFTVQSEIGAEACVRMGYANLSEWLFHPSPQMAASYFQTLCEKLTLRRAMLMGQWLSAAATCHGAEPEGLCAEVERRSAQLPAVTQTDNLRDKVADAAIAKIERMRRGEKPRRMLTPIGAWNRLFGGLADGHYYGLASRPGAGKTSALEQMVETYMAANIPALVFEKDMAPQMFIERMACRACGVPYWKFERETLNPTECDLVAGMLDALKDTPLILLSPVGLTADQMCAIVRREVRVSGVRAVFLDHIQCLRHNGTNLREGLTHSSLTIRNCVTETNVPHVVLAHLNRDGAKGRPEPEHIKEFDQFFGDVDALAMLWSEVDAADVPSGEPRPMKLYAAKNRGGAVAEEDLSYDGPILKFT